MSLSQSQKVLEVLEMDPYSDPHRQQLEVFLEAFHIFAARTERHTETWKDSGWRGALFDVRKKVDRLWNEFMVQPREPGDYDSAFDALNFLAFFVRAKQYGVTGVWRWREDSIPPQEPELAVDARALEYQRAKEAEYAKEMEEEKQRVFEQAVDKCLILYTGFSREHLLSLSYETLDMLIAAYNMRRSNTPRVIAKQDLSDR